MLLIPVRAGEIGFSSIYSRWARQGGLFLLSSPLLSWPGLAGSPGIPRPALGVRGDAPLVSPLVRTGWSGRGASGWCLPLLLGIEIAYQERMGSPKLWFGPGVCPVDGWCLWGSLLFLGLGLPLLFWIKIASRESMKGASQSSAREFARQFF